MVDQRKENYHYEEALKTLRTNIQFAGAEITSILVTSCYPNEGKSDIVSQLAKEMGKAGKKVLLLDADIRKIPDRGRDQGLIPVPQRTGCSQRYPLYNKL